MSKEELLAELQGKGLSDDEIVALLDDVKAIIKKDDEVHDEEEAKEKNEDEKMKEIFGI